MTKTRKDTASQSPPLLGLNKNIEKEIDKLYPIFDEWVHKRHFAADGIYLIKLWYQFLGGIKK